VKAQTKVASAVKACYEAYAEYSSKVVHIPVVPPKRPLIIWQAGDQRNGNAGWLVDGRLHLGTAEDVVKHFNERTEYWIAKTRRKSDPSPKNGHDQATMEIPQPTEDLMSTGEQ